ncbi:MAG: hypothetical protein WC641_01550 [Patescibacteria group bacterium]
MEDRNAKCQMPNANQPSPPVKPKLGRNFITCSLIAAFFALVVLVVFLVGITKLGIVSIPYFEKLYTGPKPTRLVAAQPLTSKEFEVLVAARLFAQQVAEKKAPYVIEIKESELTGALQTSIDSALRNDGWRQEFSQLVVRPDYLEFYGRYARGIIHAQALIRFKPVLENAALKFVPLYVQIGDFKPSPELAYKVLSFVFSRDLGAWRLSFGATGLQDMKLREGVMQLYLSK